jgi:hypothetical protein
MFIRKQQRPWIEFSPDEGQEAPALVHYFSDRCDPFKTVLAQLIATAVVTKIAFLSWNRP